MAEVQDFPLVYHYGDSLLDFSIQWVGDDDLAKDLTGYRADMKIRSKDDQTEVLHLSTDTADGLSLLDPTDGTVTFSALPSKMISGSLVGGVTYDYDLQVKSPDGSIVKTLIKGDFRVDAQVTDV